MCSIRTHQNRLFVPVMNRFFDQFANGTKTWEIRRVGRQWTSGYVYEGRRVEIRRGYSGASLWGTVTRVAEANSIENLFKKIPAQKATPTEFHDDQSSKSLTVLEFFGVDSNCA